MLFLNDIANSIIYCSACASSEQRLCDRVFCQIFI